MEFTILLSPEADCPKVDVEFTKHSDYDYFSIVSFTVIAGLSIIANCLLLKVMHILMPKLKKDQQPEYSSFFIIMSISNILLCLHWILTYAFPGRINQGIPCVASGFIALLFGFLDYIYNLIF